MFIACGDCKHNIDIGIKAVDVGTLKVGGGIKAKLVGGRTKTALVRVLPANPPILVGGDSRKLSPTRLSLDAQNREKVAAGLPVAVSST